MSAAFTTRIAAASNPKAILSLQLLKRLLIRSSGIATASPNTVVTRASEIPPERSFGSPVPYSVMTSKVAIIPVTVPSSPRRGATAANR